MSNAVDLSLEKECSALGCLFQSIVGDMKNLYPAWEDLGQKAVKLSAQLKLTIQAVNLFLDALQKVADNATNAKGATRDIGTALTRICMRNRSIENRVKTLSSALVDCLAQPIQEKSDEWRARVQALDKEHTREYKKTKAEIKKRATDTLRLKKKVRKGDSRMAPMCDSSQQEVNDRYLVFVEAERRMEFELSLMDESQHLRDVVQLLAKHSSEPGTLPPSSEAVIYDVKGLENTWTQSLGGAQSPISSPPSSSLGSRHSSFCSLNSTDLPQCINGTMRPPPQTLPKPQFTTSTSSPRNFTASQDSGLAPSYSQDPVYVSMLQQTDMDTCTKNSDDSSSGSTRASLPSSSLGSGVRPTGSVINTMDETSTPSPLSGVGQWPMPDHQASQLQAHTISAGQYDTGRHSRPSLTQAISLFVTPASNKQDSQAQPSRPGTLSIAGKKKPPLPTSTTKRRQETPLSTPTPTPQLTSSFIPDFHAAQPDQFVPQPIYANLQQSSQKQQQQQQQTNENGDAEVLLRCGSAQSNQPPPAAIRHRQQQGRPLSFVGDDEDMQRLLSVAGYMTPTWGRESSDDSSSPVKPSSNIAKPQNSDQKLTSRQQQQGASTKSDCGQFLRPSPYATLPRNRGRNAAGTGKLRSKLPGLVTSNNNNTKHNNNNTKHNNNNKVVVRRHLTVVAVPTPNSTHSHRARSMSTTGCSNETSAVEPLPDEVFETRSLDLANVAESVPSTTTSGGTLTRRASTNQRAPPPPQRRNSTITAATPTAPSVQFVRANSRCTTPVDDSHYASSMLSFQSPPQQHQQQMQPQQHQQQQQIQQHQPRQQPQIEYNHYDSSTTCSSARQSYFYKTSSDSPTAAAATTGSSSSAVCETSDMMVGGQIGQFSLVHETMLMQIRNGVTLRSARQSRDN